LLNQASPKQDCVGPVQLQLNPAGRPRRGRKKVPHSSTHTAQGGKAVGLRKQDCFGPMHLQLELRGKRADKIFSERHLDREYRQMANRTATGGSKTSGRTNGEGSSVDVVRRGISGQARRRSTRNLINYGGWQQQQQRMSTGIIGATMKSRGVQQRGAHTGDWDRRCSAWRPGRG